MAAATTTSNSCWRYRAYTSIRFRQAEGFLGDVAEDELRAHRCDAADHNLPQQPLDVEFPRIPHAAMCHHGARAGVEPRFGAEILGRVRFGSARLALVVEPSRAHA